MPDLKYLYYSQKSKHLIKLGFSSTDDWAITLVSFPFTYSTSFKSYKFETELDLVFFCNEHNREVEKKYNETYKIKPPYILRTFLDYTGENVVCLFIYKGRRCMFKDMQPIPGLNREIWNRKDDALVYDFFKECDGELFNVAFLLKLHKFALENMIFIPEITLDGKVDFNVKVKNQVYHARVHGGCYPGKSYFLHFCNISNDIVFKYYKIPGKIISYLFSVKEGLWPYSDEKTLYAIIDFINESRYANFLSQKIIIKDNVITCQFGMFTVEQNKKGKWYLKGDIDGILHMFNLSTAAELKVYVSNILGVKRRAGVFPECETKQEVIKLLNKITDCIHQNIAIIPRSKRHLLFLDSRLLMIFISHVYNFQLLFLILLGLTGSLARMHLFLIVMSTIDK